MAASKQGPAPPSPGNHVFYQLRHDIANLSDRDPDTRRSSMESLKGFIEDQLDARSIPTFLDQVSSGSCGAITARGCAGTTAGSSGSGGSFAISLFVEVARVHKQNTVPFIPRIMSSIIRSLSTTSTGSVNNLHQACAKVVSAVSRYAIEAPSVSSSSEVLNAMARPLLGHLFANVELVAVGSAVCLQALVEAENWKYAPQELVSDVCCRASMALVEKGKLTVAHMGLVKSLAKFNPAGLHSYGASLLKIAVNILCLRPMNGIHSPGRSVLSSWQQRVSSAQLIAAVLTCLDPRFLGVSLAPTTEALEGCRFDRNATIRQAVGEALSVAKSLASKVDPLMLHDDHAFEESVVSTLSTPPRSRLPDARKRTSRRKNLWKTEESSGSTLSFNDLVVGSQESHMMSSYSPGSVTALSMSSPSPPSTACSAVKIGRSPLYPAKQSPVIPSSVGRLMVENELQFLLDHIKSSDSKENAPFVGKSVEPISSIKSEDLKITKEMGVHTQNCDAENEKGNLLCELPGETKHVVEDEVWKEKHISSEDWLSSTALDEICDKELCPNDLQFEDVIVGQRHQIEDIIGGHHNQIENVTANHHQIEDFKGGNQHQEENIDEVEEKKVESVHVNTCSAKEKKVESVHANTCSALESLVNPQQEEQFSLQVTKKRIPSEDFLIFSTPRRLVRRLQSVTSTPESKGTMEGSQDFETISESGWSVRDNPIAGDSDDDSPRETVLMKNMETPLLKRSFSQCSSVTQVDEEKDICVSASMDYIDSDCGISLRTDLSLSHPDVFEYDTPQDSKTKLEDEKSYDCIGDCGTPTIDTESSEVGVTPNSNSQSKIYKRDWSLCASRIHYCAEMSLTLALLVVLLFTIMIAVLNCINGPSDLHTLVPT